MDTQHSRYCLIHLNPCVRLRRVVFHGSPAILGHLPVRSVTLRPLLSQSLPFSCYNANKA